jgi:hypothetical protein
MLRRSFRTDPICRLWNPSVRRALLITTSFVIPS